MILPNPAFPFFKTMAFSRELGKMIDVRFPAGELDSVIAATRESLSLSLGCEALVVFTASAVAATMMLPRRIGFGGGGGGCRLGSGGVLRTAETCNITQRKY